MISQLKIYKSFITISDKDSNHTAVDGERCSLDSIYIKNGIAYVRLINSQSNILNIPFDVFEKCFSPSSDQTSKL
jgi:hypothetical protein